VLEPVLPLAPALPVPAPPLLLGEALEPLEDEPMLPDVEPLAEPWSFRQRSFSAPVRVSHCVLLPLREGELVELPLALGDEVEEPVEPLAEEPVLPDPPTLCDDDCAIAAAETANSAAIVAVESVFNIIASPMVRFRDGDCAGTNASSVP
jgi:hypothetical protein